MENVKTEPQKITAADCSSLSLAVNDLLMSVPSISGGLLIFFKSAQKKLDAINKQSQKRQEAILKKNIKVDKKGNFVVTEPTEEEVAQGIQPEYVYKSDDHKQKAEADLKKLYDGEVKTKFNKISGEEIARLQITPSRNQRFALIMEFLLEEQPDSVMEVAN